MWITFGHQNQKDFLSNALKSGKLAHAYLFVGPQQVGKRSLAKEFAQKLLGVDQSKPGFNPDLIEVNGSSAKIEDMRKLMADLAYRPYQSKYKVAIIDNFDSIGDEAANSILKTLEEPNGSTILVLIASGTKTILPTILSRSQTLHFNRIDPGSALPAGVDAKKLFEICDGKFGKYQMLQEHAEELEQLQSQLSFWQKLKNQGIAERILAIKEFSEMEPAEIAQIMNSWLDAEHYQTIAARPQGFQNLSLLCQSISGLSRNFNKKLILENLFLNVR